MRSATQQYKRGRPSGQHNGDMAKTRQHLLHTTHTHTQTSKTAAERRRHSERQQTQQHTDTTPQNTWREAHTRVTHSKLCVTCMRAPQTLRCGCRCAVLRCAVLHCATVLLLLLLLCARGEGTRANQRPGHATTKEEGTKSHSWATERQGTKGHSNNECVCVCLIRALPQCHPFVCVCACRGCLEPQLLEEVLGSCNGALCLGGRALGLVGALANVTGTREIKGAGWV